MRFYTDF